MIHLFTLDKIKLIFKIVDLPNVKNSMSDNTNKTFHKTNKFIGMFGY